jgi:hypothetical protein
METRWNRPRALAFGLAFFLAFINRGAADAFVRPAKSVAAGDTSGYAGGKAGDKKDKSEKSESAHSVDSGSFGIFINEQRVATETFTIRQVEGGSEVKSQLKETVGADPASQKSDLEITSTGNLIRYEWSQSSGGSLTVFPDNDFLKERITASPGAKAAEQAFLLPTSTPLLDNNFFVHREILAWRYLSSACKTEGTNLKCPQDAADFGALIPQDRLSLPVRLELVGKEKITIRGTARDLLHLKLTGESFEWGLWLDDQDHYKLIRVAIPADNTEVIRD